MPRLPAGWGQYFHKQANRPGNTFAWHPGWRHTGQQPIRRVPVAAYTVKAQGVPLTGGQAQGLIAGVPAGSGSVTSPGGFTTIASVVIPVAGVYRINWTVTLAGTTSATEVNNFRFVQNLSFLDASVNASAPGSYPQAVETVTAAAGDRIQILNASAGTSGAVYSATIGAADPTPVLTLTAGPQGLANVWYPAQVTLSTTTGVLDTSTALVYLGAQGVPITLVGSVFSGNGTVALAIPSMSPGQVLIVTWTNGHPGDTAAFNIVGTMDALRTG